MGRRTVLLAAVALAAVVALAVPGTGQPALADDAMGDVDCDTAVNTIDVMLILQRHAGLIDSLPCLQNADVDLDASVTAVDAVLVLQFAAGLIGTLPPPSIALRDIPESCGWRQLSDATLIANDTLTRSSSSLYLDRDERDALSEELEGVLARIRDAYPAVAHIRVWESYIAGMVVVTPEPALRDAIQALIPDDRGLVTFVTGFSAFDDLNARLGLRSIHRLKLRSINTLLLSLCFDDHLNVPAAAAAYRDLDGVWSATPNAAFGDGPDIEAMRSGETWYAVFRDAWGDCPSGCTGEELFFFTALGDEVTKLDENEARADPVFLELLDRLGPGLGW